jgi:hypothetical protein
MELGRRNGMGLKEKSIKHNLDKFNKRNDREDMGNGRNIKLWG